MDVRIIPRERRPRGWPYCKGDHGKFESVPRASLKISVNNLPRGRIFIRPYKGWERSPSRKSPADGTDLVDLPQKTDRPVIRQGAIRRKKPNRGAGFPCRTVRDVVMK